MRLDQALVEQRLAPSRARAQQLIRAGSVLVDGVPAKKPSASVAGDAALCLREDALDYVSRAALKLVGGLDGFELDPRGLTAMDVGSSTGGFTEVLLRRGASHVFAVDVGRDQLHPSLRADRRVTSLESTHAKELSAELIPMPIDLVVCDVSFISICKALPAALALTRDGARLLTLIKPQFELGPDAIGKNGRVLTPEPEQLAFINNEIIPFFGDLGWRSKGVIDSPILGGDGTKEFLLYAEKTPS